VTAQTNSFKCCVIYLLTISVCVMGSPPNVVVELCFASCLLVQELFQKRYRNVVYKTWRFSELLAVVMTEEVYRTSGVDCRKPGRCADAAATFSKQKKTYVTGKGVCLTAVPTGLSENCI
jgi:hypothetical protein